MVLKIDGRTLEEPSDLIALVRKYAPGAVVTVEFRRGSGNQTASVTLAADAKYAFRTAGVRSAGGVFENLNWWEIGALLLVALLIFGDKLPNVITDGLRMLRNLRNMARSATSDLSRELGTDIQLEDLHPKAFIRKHLLSEDEQEAIRKPLKGMFDNVKSDIQGVRDELSDVASAADVKAPAKKAAAPAPRAIARSYDDAT